MKTRQKPQIEQSVIDPNELEQLVREGEQLLINPNQIHVTFQQSDIDQATSFGDLYNCYLCIALRRMGYKVIRVSGDFARINHAEEKWGFDDGSEANPKRGIWENGARIIGKTLILTKRT